MSRRRDPDVDIIFRMLHLDCAKGHRIGVVVLQRAGGGNPFKIGLPLERVDGPNGETKVLAVCPTCAKAGSRATPQVRWTRLQAILEEMEQTQEHYRTITVT